MEWVLGPTTQKVLASNISRDETYITHPFMGEFDTGFSCHGVYLYGHGVYLYGQTCTCLVWQMSGIPCDHACATIRRIYGDFSKYVDDWYKLKT